MRQTVYSDLMAKYENPIEHTCDVTVGQQWISVDGKCPEGLCPSAWLAMREFVESLARGEGNFYDGWMKNPNSAMISFLDIRASGTVFPSLSLIRVCKNCFLILNLFWGAR